MDKRMKGVAIFIVSVLCIMRLVLWAENIIGSDPAGIIVLCGFCILFLAGWIIPAKALYTWTISGKIDMAREMCFRELMSVLSFFHYRGGTLPSDRFPHVTNLNDSMVITKERERRRTISGLLIILWYFVSGGAILLYFGGQL